ncbi:MAG: tRNA (N6-isopentenyl adenosine(37)-C2)-methylthiotransferase MiaB [Rickettsiales bacterium]|jgi:tRNA-2-methylthio-N6-dimethylallyladenosine synthase|nr:tRNA (N6-isopentenyl adenosine(37)-C2)-methylthiotransferase MiaB [Rickettsiales bacterium]
MKKIFSKSFGCQMNVYDSNRIVDIMKTEGYEDTQNIAEADLIVINTCSIREKAKEKVFSEIGRIDEVRKKDAILVIAGCVAQMASDEIKKRIKGADIVIGATNYHKLPEMVRSGGGVKLDFLAKEKFNSLPQNRIIKGVSEFIAVQEGCDKFCSFCIVPFTRGREFSRNFSDIIDEAKNLADNGVKEITLLGQNVDNYNDNGKTLADLIFAINDIDGIKRIRYMTSYPTQVGQDLIEAHANVTKLMPFIHLPIQSGSNAVLKRMNRRYTAEQYLNVVENLRKARPDIAISSDFIVGFAGETDKDFDDTLELCKQVKFSSTFSFKYSIRPGTAGEKMKEQVDEKVKEERLRNLQNLLNDMQLEYNKNFDGKEMEVLIESLSNREDGTYFGKSPYSQTIVCDKGAIGEIIRVKIDKVGMKLLEGKKLF